MGISIMIGNRIATGKKSGAGYSGPAPLVHYDFSRYSNEDFLNNPDMLVKDITGNGHDLKLYNFAFSGMSGFGGYEKDWETWLDVYTGNGGHNYLEDNTLHILEISPWANTFSDVVQGEKVSLKIRVAGLTESIANGEVQRMELYFNVSGVGSDFKITEDGDYDVSLIAPEGATRFFILTRSKDTLASWMPLSTPITVEQLPTYPGGLVSDGVDDYGECVKQFVLTDFTVVAVRNYADFTQAVNSTLVSKVTGYDNNGAFLFEDGTEKRLSYSFGTGIRCSERPSLFSYITKTSNNGTNMTPGTVVDKLTNMLRIFTRCLPCPKTSAVLYELRIYDYSLTKEELQLVKDDMMRNYEKLVKSYSIMIL